MFFIVDIFTRSFDDLISMKFLIAVLLPASSFNPTSMFINFGDFCQPPCLLFWPKFASLPVSSALPFYLKFDSKILNKLTYQMSVLPSYRKQSIDLMCISIDRFLYEGNTDIKWVKLV